MVAGGLFNIRFDGAGLLAITTHYDPITLRVTPRQAGLHRPQRHDRLVRQPQPEFKTDVSLQTFFGRGSGESIQMMFNGDGFVVIQPYEEVAFQGASGQAG